MNLTKPWDVKALVEYLKPHGLDIGEDAVKHVVEGVFEFIGESVKLTPTPVDNLILVVLPVIKKQVLTEIDKIDGAVG